MFGLLLAGSRYGAYALGALASGSIKEPAWYFKSASEISWAYFLGTEVGFFSALVGLGLSYHPIDHLARREHKPGNGVLLLPPWDALLILSTRAGEAASHRSRPTAEREWSFVTCWRTPKWQSSSEVPVTFPGRGAVCNPVRQSQTELAIWCRCTAHCHAFQRQSKVTAKLSTSIMKAGNKQWKRLSVVLQGNTRSSSKRNNLKINLLSANEKVLVFNCVWFPCMPKTHAVSLIPFNCEAFFFHF